ncbi:MAG: Lrp/AsnC family transcriptional regulator [Paracoccaceae bacterium]
MDKLDNRIIALLRHNARAALSDLASELRVSRATVRTRMERMQNSGEIVGFTVVTKGDHSASPVCGLMMIGIEGRGTERIIRLLRGIPEVTAVHTTNGKWDLIVEIGTDTLENLDKVLDTVRQFDGVSNSETNLFLTTRKSR